MSDGYEEDVPQRKLKISTNADLLEYRIESLEREMRMFRGQADRKNRELDDVIQRRFGELSATTQQLNKEAMAVHEKRTKEIADLVEKKDKEIVDGHEKRLKEVEVDFDKRTSRIESFLLGGLCLVATLFIGALFALTKGNVPGVPGG